MFAQQKVPWQSESTGVAITAVPAGWRVLRSDAVTLELGKRFISSRDLWYDESITVTCGSQSMLDLERATDQMQSSGYTLVDRDRINFSGTDAPYWLFRQDTEDASNWVALVMHSSVSTVVKVRATPLDPNHASYVFDVLEALRIAGSPRDRAWQALTAGDAASARDLFQSLVRADSLDANARYGLGLSFIALRNYDAAVNELRKAQPALGLSEDVRRALGEAELGRGNADRGVALWIQVMRANPEWGERLRPAVLKATANASAPTGDDLHGVTDLAMSFLARLERQAPASSLNALLYEYQHVFEQAIDHCLASHCSGRAGLLPAYDIERAMLSAIDATESENGDVDAQKMKIVAAISDLATHTVSLEEQ